MIADEKRAMNQRKEYFEGLLGVESKGEEEISGARDGGEMNWYG